MEGLRDGDVRHGRTPERNISLRCTARVHEIDRRLRSMSFARSARKWIGLPGLVLAAPVVGYFPVTRPATLTSAMVLPALLWFVALSVFWSSSRQLQVEEEQLRSERADLVAGGSGEFAFHLQHPERGSRSA